MDQQNIAANQSFQRTPCLFDRNSLFVKENTTGFSDGAIVES